MGTRARSLEINGEVDGAGFDSSLGYLVARNSQLQADNRRLRINLQKMQRLAYLDALTELPNRRYFDDAIAAEMRRSVRASSPLSLLVCDVDHFKYFNDTFGHATGDSVLVDVATVLQRCCRRGGDMVARIGGDEFALLLPNTNEEACGIFVDRIRRETGRAIPSHGARRVTLSIGSATYPGHGKDADTSRLFRLADDALYQAKQSGRNSNRISMHN